MAVSPARAAAFEILLRIERDQAYATELLHSAAYAKLAPVDHGLATEIVMGVLRWRSLLDGHIDDASSQKHARLDVEVLTALRMGAYQLGFLSRVPSRAAIYESVELVKAARKRSAAPFANAVLRTIDKSAKDRGASSALEAIRGSLDAGAVALNSAHPQWLVDRWTARYGLENARRICAYDQSVPSTTIHLRAGAVAGDLAGTVELAPGSTVSCARKVIAGDVAKLRTFAPGSFSIQDEGSQLVALLAGHGEKILDCCAAPGGKSRLLAWRNPRAKVYALELHPHRARLLKKLADLPNLRIIGGDARSLPFSTTFDLILTDVPCSGTGTLARNPEIKWSLKPADLDDLKQRQVAILKSALGHLSRGGRLVYSTCSLEPEENEAVVDAALCGEKEFQLIECRAELERLRKAGNVCAADLGSLVDGPYLRTLPGLHECDGFFAAMITRKSA